MPLVRSIHRVAIVSFVALAVGCGGGDDSPRVAPVSGTVLLDGNPLPDAVVTFHLEGGGAPRNAQGRTNASGKFTLTTFNTNDGALLGTHKATVAGIDTSASSESMDAGDPNEAYTRAMLEAANPKAKPKDTGVPSKYSSVNSTPLLYTVREGSNEFTLELNSTQ